ncbi:MAG: fibrobacter succinogenes major paralogous domain-containing protein [Flavobacterium sp.]|nr:fibrobacter succinogenes major paralogous domain-containing protein [Flavobacterium sp.]
MKHLYLFISLFILALTQGQTPQNDSVYFWKSGIFIDRISIKNADLDSITFKRPPIPPVVIPNVIICNQTWMIKNLDVTTYSDGTNIPNVTNQNAWINLTTGAWCYYNNDIGNSGYGKLYNWYAVAGIYDAASLANPALRKKLAPTGWHVASDAEWTTLTTCAGVDHGSFKDRFSWTYWQGLGIPSNSTGFTALPGGLRSTNVFEGVSGSGNWWTSSENSTIDARWRRMIYTTDSVYSNVNNKSWGFSVRCLKD